ncbi:MAG: YdjY domain-containing protein [Phycisphaera sp.]|nr:MAG: YdjY domain-containing protein [Phycisphaera sp.]
MARDTERPPAPEPSQTVTLAQGLRLNRTERWIELDGFVPIDVREQDRTGYTLIRYLECIAVTPASGKDHEALMVTSVRPSTIHAALLTIGLEPGAPAGIIWDGQSAIATPATGDPVRITYRIAEQPAPGNPIAHYITHADTGEAFDEQSLGETPQWVFAGSLIENGSDYAADSEGLTIGLHTFGTELVALRMAISPDSFIQPPEWIAHPELTPPFGTDVTIRIAAKN